MIICDVNVLIYAMREDSPGHEQCLDLVQGWLEEGELAWLDSIGASVIRVTTNPKFGDQPSTLEQCLEFLDPIRKIATRARLDQDIWTEFHRLVKDNAIIGPHIQDAYWAAIAIANKATFVTADRGFTRFNNLNLQLLAF